MIDDNLTIIHCDLDAFYAAVNNGITRLSVVNRLLWEVAPIPGELWLPVLMKLVVLSQVGHALARARRLCPMRYFTGGYKRYAEAPAGSISSRFTPDIEPSL